MAKSSELKRLLKLLDDLEHYVYEHTNILNNPRDRNRFTDMIDEIGDKAEEEIL